jgi:hypothetical protein
MLAGEGLYGFCVLGLEAPLTIETDVAFVPEIEELEPDIEAWVNPSPKTDFDQSDNKTGAKRVELIRRAIKKKESFDEFMN